VIALRRAGPDDAAAVADVFTASFAGLLGFVPKLHTAEDDRAFFHQAVVEREVWIAEEGGAVLGLAAIHGDELGHLYVRPDRQGEGVGGMLLGLVKRERPNGFRLWVFQQNTGARRFYERHGLRLVRETDGSANEERTPDALYEWRPPDGSARP
jgi:GNAT superfamily N-acetyltransferase